MRYLIEFFVALLLWFWVFFYIGRHPELVDPSTRSSKYIFAAAFVVVFGRYVILAQAQDPKRFAVLGAHLAGLALGACTAAWLLVPEFRALFG